MMVQVRGDPRVCLAYRVQWGEITGRVKDAAVAGTAYDLHKENLGMRNEVAGWGALVAVAPRGGQRRAQIGVE